MLDDNQKNSIKETEAKPETQPETQPETSPEPISEAAIEATTSESTPEAEPSTEMAAEALTEVDNNELVDPEVGLQRDKRRFNKNLVIFLGVDCVILLLVAITFILFLNKNNELQAQIDHVNEKPAVVEQSEEQELEAELVEEPETPQPTPEPIPPATTETDDKEKPAETTKPKPDFTVAKQRAKSFETDYGIKLYFADNALPELAKDYDDVSNQLNVISAIYKLEPIMQELPCREFFADEIKEFRIALVDKKKSDEGQTVITTRDETESVTMIVPVTSDIPKGAVYSSIFRWIEDVLASDLAVESKDNRATEINAYNPAGFNYGDPVDELHISGPMPSFINRSASESLEEDRRQTFLFMANHRKDKFIIGSPLQQKALHIKHQIQANFDGADQISWLNEIQ